MQYEQQNLNIKIQKISLEELEQLEKSADTLEEQKPVSVLYYSEDSQDIKLLFYSNNKSIRPLEFMDYLVQEYVLVQGTGNIAQAVLTSILLHSMMSDFEADSIEKLFEKIIENYFSKCKWIYAVDYAKNNKDIILQMPKYAKKKITWAFVRSTDIIEEGKTFSLKSLENEAGIVLQASPDLYIMIGKYGEIYHIRRERFEETYETLEEPIDIFEQMFVYLPEVRACDTDEFITLDEIAYICWPKQNGGIYAVSLEDRTKVFNPYNEDEYFIGRKGDYLAIRQDDLSDIYIIKNSIFNDTYEKIEQ